MFMCFFHSLSGSIGELPQESNPQDAVSEPAKEKKADTALDADESQDEAEPEPNPKKKAKRSVAPSVARNTFFNKEQTDFGKKVVAIKGFIATGDALLTRSKASALPDPLQRSEVAARNAYENCVETTVSVAKLWLAEEALVPPVKVEAAEGTADKADGAEGTTAVVTAAEEKASSDTTTTDAAGAAEVAATCSGTDTTDAQQRCQIALQGFKQCDIGVTILGHFRTKAFLERFLVTAFEEEVSDESLNKKKLMWTRMVRCVA